MSENPYAWTFFQLDLFCNYYGTKSTWEDLRELVYCRVVRQADIEDEGDEDMINDFNVLKH